MGKEQENPPQEKSVKADKLTEVTALLAFYHNVANLYEDVEKFEDDNIKGMMLREQIGLLVSVHKTFAELHNIDIPDYDKTLFNEYINIWNDNNTQREEYYRELIKNHNKKDEVSDYFI